MASGAPGRSCRKNLGRAGHTLAELIVVTMVLGVIMAMVITPTGNAIRHARVNRAASVVKMGGPAIHLSMLAPLLIMVAGFTAFYLTVLIMRMRTEIVTAKLRSLQIDRTERQS